MKILFTGASGFLGRCAAPRLAAEHEVVGTYDRNECALDGVRMLRLDLEDEERSRALVDAERPDLVVHAAAISRPQACLEDPLKARRINVGAARYLAEASPRFLFFSTDLVFDGDRGAYREADPVSPVSLYAQTKADAERAVLDANPNSLVLRLALTYGWGSASHPVFCDELYGSIRSGKGMNLFSDQFRSMLYVKDAAQLLLRVADRAWPAGSDRIFHCGGPETVSRVRFGRLFCGALKLDDSKITEVSMADLGLNNPPDCSLNSARLYEFTEFHPRTPEEGVRDMALDIP